MLQRTFIVRKIVQYFVILTLITLPVDQWTKSFSKNNYLIHEDAEDTTIYQGRRLELFTWQEDSAWLVVYATYVRNHGVSWGLMRGLSEAIRIPILVFVGALFSMALFWVAFKLLEVHSKKLAFCLIALIAGSLGNLLDRLRLGYVVDFLSVRAGVKSSTYALPSFNVADMIIVISLICLIVMALLKKDRQEPL